MKNGYISLFRKLMDKGYYKDSEYVHLWIHLLLKANYKKNKLLWNNKEIEIKKGQFITSRKKLSEETGINESKIERILKLFETEQQIEQQSLHTSRLITVNNYKEHQQSEQQNEQRVNSERTVSEQRVNTNNKDNKDNKDNKEKKKKVVPNEKSSGQHPITFNFTTEQWENIKDKDIARWKETYPACDIKVELNRAADWLVSNPSKRKKNYKAFISRWLSKQQDRGGTKGMGIDDRKPSEWAKNKSKEMLNSGEITQEQYDEWEKEEND